MDLASILKEYGFPVLAAIAVGYAYWRATQDRIKKLEQITAKQGATIEELQNDRLKRAEGYATVLKDVVLKVSGAMKEIAQTQREGQQIINEQHKVLSKLIDNINSLPCQETRAFHKPPSRDDLPPPPERPGKAAAPPTDLFPTSSGTDSTDL